MDPKHGATHMALIGPAGALMAISVVFMWVAPRLTKWTLMAEEDSQKEMIGSSALNELIRLYQLALLVLFLLVFGDGIASAVRQMINFIL
jgi:hypothetical protein